MLKGLNIDVLFNVLNLLNNMCVWSLKFLATQIDENNCTGS